MSREIFSVKKVLALALFCLSLNLSLAQEVNTCESIQVKVQEPEDDEIICFMDQKTKIESQNSTVEVHYFNTNVNELQFTGNKKIFYLPVRLDETFFNLIAYFADSCSLTIITKENFANLRSLKFLLLADNQIQVIRSETFQDFTSLETLKLSRNQLKSIDNDVFYNLGNLQNIYLEGNNCIDTNFNSDTQFNLLDVALINRCGFTENEYASNDVYFNVFPDSSEPLDPLGDSPNYLMIISNLKDELRAAYDEATDIKMQRSENLAAITSLKNQLNESEYARDQCLSLANEMYEIEIEEEELDEKADDAVTKAREAEQEAEETAQKTAKMREDFYEMLRSFKLDV